MATNEIPGMAKSAPAPSGTADLHHLAPGNPASNAAMAKFLNLVVAYGDMGDGKGGNGRGKPGTSMKQEAETALKQGAKYGMAQAGWNLFQKVAASRPELMAKIDRDGSIRETLHADESLPNHGLSIDQQHAGAGQTQPLAEQAAAHTAKPHAPAQAHTQKPEWAGLPDAPGKLPA